MNEGMTRSEGLPLVSVIMAAYNREDYLPAAIESVMGQTYDNWELLCVDDGSADSTPDIIRDYEQRDRRVRGLLKARNEGAAATRNVGIERARGDFIAILDSDDVALADRLERSVHAFELHQAIDAVGSQAIHIDAEGSPREGGRWIKHVVEHTSIMVRAARMREVGGYDPFFRISEDSDLYYRLAACGCVMRVLRRPLVQARWHGKQLSASDRKLHRAYGVLAAQRAQALEDGIEFDLAENLDRLLRDSRVEAQTIYERAWDHLLVGNARQARTDFLGTLRLQPLRVSAVMWLLLSYAPRSPRDRMIQSWFGAKRSLARRMGTLPAIWQAHEPIDV